MNITCVGVKTPWVKQVLRIVFRIPPSATSSVLSVYLRGAKHQAALGEPTRMSVSGSKANCCAREGKLKSRAMGSTRTWVPACHGRFNRIRSFLKSKGGCKDIIQASSTYGNCIKEDFITSTYLIRNRDRANRNSAEWRTCDTGLFPYLTEAIAGK